MRLIAKVDNDSLGLVRENEILGLTLEQERVMLELGYAEVYDDTKPLVGKGVTTWEPKSYPINRQVFKNDSVYISTCQTSTTWIYNIDPFLSEWACLVHGKNAL